MIMVPMDEAGAFDLYTIAEIKLHKGLASNAQQLIEAIRKAIGVDKCSEIERSRELRDLTLANYKMWGIQEQSMRDLCKASDVDKQNQKRFHAKAALQARFFSTPLTEQKSVRPYEQQDSKP